MATTEAAVSAVPGVTWLAATPAAAAIGHAWEDDDSALYVILSVAGRDATFSAAPVTAALADVPLFVDVQPTSSVWLFGGRQATVARWAAVDRAAGRNDLGLGTAAVMTPEQIAADSTFTDTYAAVAALGPRTRPPAPVPTSMITTFQTGHGWFSGGMDNALRNLNDTSDYCLGLQAATMVSKTDNTLMNLSNYPISAIDMTGKQFIAWVKVDVMTRLQYLQLRVGSHGDFAQDYYNLRASGGANQNAIVNSNEWVPITFGWADATSSGSPNRAAITAIGVYAQPNGAGAATYVRVNGIGVMPEPANAWATGVVSVTFDDSLVSQYTMARAAMDKYGFPGVAYTIVENIGSDGNHLSLVQAQALQDNCGWEISGHAYTVAAHNSANGLPDLSAADLDVEMRQLKTWLLQYGFRGSDWYAYPQGKFNSTVELVVGRYFSSAVTTDHWVAQTLPFSRPLRVARMSVTPGDSTATVIAEIDKAYANRTWLILCFHKIVTSGAALSTEYNVADFQTIIDYCASKPIPVRTIGFVMESLGRL
jgi:hypothetical protein